jgi:hypothetical protein
MIGTVAHAHDVEASTRMEAMVDDGRLDDILAEVSLAEIAAAWVCYESRAANSSDDDDWWAIEFWLGLGYQREDVAREGLLALVSAAPDELLGHVGAGPFENFICADEDRIAWMEQQAAASSRFRAALANIHVWGVEKRWVAERLERAAGVALKRPRW